MSTEISREFYFELQKGNVESSSVVHKFGTNEGLTSNWAVISTTGTYETPNSSKILEIVSSDAGDSLTGLGARSVTIIGLNSTWEEISIDVNMDGTTPVTLPSNFTRVYRAFVKTTGTYATQSAGSHIGTLTIRETGGGLTWTEIGFLDGFPSGQTEIGAYTIPKGKTGYMFSKSFTVEANKPVDVTLFFRSNVNETLPPYGGVMRVQQHIHGMETPYSLMPQTPLLILNELTDVGFLAKTGASGSIAVDFEIVVIDNNLIEYNGEGNMALAIIILIPIFIIALLLAVSFALDPEKYWALKLGLIMLSFVFVFQSYQLSTVIISEYIGGSALINMLADHALTFALVFGAIISIFLIHFIKDIFDIFQEKKQKTGDYS